MNIERHFSLRPGEAILHDNGPLAVRYRGELKSYLDKYPKGRDRNDIKSRLWSFTETGFYSACFELFLYDLLADRSITITPHPLVTGATTHPDYEIAQAKCRFFMEATLALESEEQQEQEQRLRELVDAVRSVTGGVVLWAQPATHIPADFPLDSVREFLEREIGQLSDVNCQAHPKTLTFEGRFKDLPVVIDFQLMGIDNAINEPVVQAWGSPKAKAVTTHHRIRRRVGVKAGKYGDLTAPYVIAVWPRTEFPLTRKGALDALYGDEKIHISRLPGGGIAGHSRAWNGAFNTAANGVLLNRSVSAVALYRERFSYNLYSRDLAVYHNPYALRPLSEEAFLGLPQFVFRKDTSDDGNMLWLNEADPWKRDGL